MHAKKFSSSQMVKTILLRQDPPLCKNTGGLFVYPLPHLKRWCLVCIAPTLSGIETKKKIQTSLGHFSSNASFIHTEFQSLKSNLEAKKFVHLGNQTGGFLHSPLPLHKVGPCRVHML